MKRILIFSHAMELGGAERALLGILENLDYKNYRVDLFLMRNEGELLPYIPSQVNILPQVSQYACLAVPIYRVIKRGQIAVAFGRMKGKLSARYKVKRLKLPVDNAVALEYSHKFTLPYMPKVGNGEYDLAISFLTPHYFVMNKVKAKSKVAWIHTDYSKVRVDANSELKMWGAYDYIISISDSVTESFLTTFPSLESKVKVIENIMPTKCINNQVTEFSVEDEMISDGSIKLLSIGRFCTAKNFDNVPDICRRILDSGLNVKWYLIGFGGDEELIRHKINESHMHDRVIILGKKVNPYPYIKACDLYVQPSRYEGNSVTVHEAQCLGKPVIITRYPTSSSQLKDGVDGLIVPLSNSGCAEGIAKVLQFPERMASLVRYCEKHDYSNRDEVRKIYKFIK